MCIYIYICRYISFLKPSKSESLESVFKIHMKSKATDVDVFCNLFSTDSYSQTLNFDSTYINAIYN